MPSIAQLPPATGSNSSDLFPVSQSGTTRSVSVQQVLAGTQPQIVIPSPTLLGRQSLGPGGPEALGIGIGLALQGGNLTATGGELAGFPVETALNLTDQVILNSSGSPAQIAITALRGLFSPGSDIQISQAGQISAQTDPSVTASLKTLTTAVALNALGQIGGTMAGPVTLGQVQVAAGAPSRTLGARALDTINVVDFGAVPNGSDSTAAFGAAFAAVPASGGEIFIPAGDYMLSASLVWAGKPLTIRGAGKAITRLHFSHTGIGFDIAQTVPTNRTVLRDFSAFAENLGGQTAAVARLNYPAETSFGYVSGFITDIECFSYPNPINGTAPFPQTFQRGFILNGCWSVQVNNVSWFGPPGAPGSTTAAAIEVNTTIDTRITGLQAYFGHAAVLQTAYCEGIYFTNPLLVGVDYLFTQTDITKWMGYTPTRQMLLGLWAANGELNCALGVVQAAAVGGGYFVGLDITRESGPNTPQVAFNLTDVSGFYILACGFIGGPSGGNNQDTAIKFQSTFNSSGNVVGGCNFQDMATIINIGTTNATVGLTTFGLNPNNVPVATAFVDNSATGSSNFIVFQSPGTAVLPAGIANTKDHVFAASDGTPLFRITNIPAATNYVRVQPAQTGKTPAIVFDGGDTTVGGSISTKAGPLSLAPGGGLFMPGLPTKKPPAGSGQIWNNGGVLNIA